MKIKQPISFLKYLASSVLNSYGMLFFSKNRFFSLLILIVSFSTPFTGASGLAALLVALIAAQALGFGKDQIEKGLLTYSVILFGLGMGSNFEMGFAFVSLLVIGSLLCLFLSVTLNAKFNKQGLPALSLAFIISSGIIIIASKSFAGIGLTSRHIYWFNEVYDLGGNALVNFIQRIENLPMSDFIVGFFRSMSAIIFQVNIAAGIVLAIGMLIFSRIGFLLMVIGYAVALAFGYAMGGFNFTDMTYYNMGTNFMLVSLALGGFYLIPSLRSFLWVLITVPIAYLLVVSLGSIAYRIGVPVYSLPFCLVVILFLYMLQLRKKQSKLVLTPIQYYSPEINLYRFLNGKERLMNNFYFQFQLPFIGEWMVSQGYDGSMTHKGDWSKALDFVILDHEMKTYQNPGTLTEHFYCFNKPVLSPAEGIIEEVVDFIEDNEIGKNNTAQNWGNTIVIKHADGLYSKLSHLKKNSIKIVKGAYVKKGEMIAACGNSGRSPEPHLHFQIQSTPYIGSKTIQYPFAYFYTTEGKSTQLKRFTVPEEGNFVSNISQNKQLQQAFNFQPGFILKVNAPGFVAEEWEVVTSIYNESYLYCKQKNAFAYFIKNETVFYFTNYFGSKNSLLYFFYLSAYKVLLSTEKNIAVSDEYPINVFGLNPVRWLQDIVAPFYIFIKRKFESSVIADGGALANDNIIFTSSQTQQLFWQQKEISQSSVQISAGQLSSFTIKINHKTIQASCIAEN